MKKINAEVEVEVLNPEAVSISTEEEGMIIDFGQGEEEGEEVRDHNENIAEFLEEGELDKLGQELVNDFNSDRQSRSDWARAYVKGLDLLGLKIEERTQPWAGASGVFHPMMTEAVIRFQAHAMAELFPPSGPVRTKILGKMSSEKAEQASRVER